jgi:hypothetical protein
MTTIAIKETYRQRWARIRSEQARIKRSLMTEQELEQEREQIRNRHLTHQVEVRPGKAHNAGELYCTECQKHIQWLSRQDYEFLLKEIK